MQSKAVIQTMRLPFLILTPVCIFLGVSAVVVNMANINWYLLVPALLGALFAHISVNTFNEYLDFKSGLDLTTIRTPFSGGSGALPNNPEAASAVFTVGTVSFMATLVIGIFFVRTCGIGVLPIGALGFALITTYTEWLNKNPFLCLVAPGTGFGFLMVVGTYYILAGEYTLLPWVIAVIPFFLVNNLLLLNQYPDIQADIRVGRNHFPIAYGTKNSNMIYAFFALATIAVISTCIMIGYFPTLSLIAMLPLPLAFFALKGAIKYGENIGNHPQYLGANVAVAILAPLLLGMSLIFG
ncbi:MAG: prenyltransferase [Methylococcaceae bacterium]